MSKCVQTFDRDWSVWPKGFVVLHGFVHQYGPELEPQVLSVTPELPNTLKIMKERQDKEQLSPEGGGKLHSCISYDHSRC